MKRTATTLVIASLLIAGAIYAASRRGTGQTSSDDTASDNKPEQVQRTKAKQPRIDIAIALDTSGSMSGLINAAREKLWTIVNEASRTQPAPILRVALLTYGSSGSEADGYVVLRSDLTDDLDSIYSKLFELRTSGGTEYVGRVVHRATHELAWSQDPDALKQIFVAGNESADQDRRVTAVGAATAARQRGIFVNAIFCGSKQSSDAPSWAHVASIGAGAYAAIDHNHGTVSINTPYDQRLNALSRALNGTYVGYGNRGRSYALRQQAQDSNAASVSAPTAAARAVAKSSASYNNADWDLVDARRRGKKVERTALPGALKQMSEGELKDFVARKAAERERLQSEIRLLAKKRRSYIAKESKKAGKGGEASFDFAVRHAIKAQAAKKGIKLEN